MPSRTLRAGRILMRANFRFYFPAEYEIIVAFLAIETAERTLQKKG
ncbi:MAG: hypothetical protein LAN18_08425 [Acidobacteriia bacterium]|nr:hypothetical protein [Terriglobia bacterium]